MIIHDTQHAVKMVLITSRRQSQQRLAMPWSSGHHPWLHKDMSSVSGFSSAHQR